MKRICVDAGGSKCVGALIHNGVKKKSVESGFGNILIDKERAIVHLMCVIDKLYESSVQKIVIGLSGALSRDTTDVKKTLENMYCIPVEIIPDVVLAYRAVLPEGGVLVIAGTGSVAVCETDKTWQTAGGWGHLLGDEGSGYSVGIRALKQAIAEYESGMETPLIKAIKTYYCLANFEEIKFLYQCPKAKVAELSYALSNHQFADVFFIQESRELAKTVKRMLTRYELEIKIIGLTGGLMKNTLFKKHLKEALGDEFTYLEHIGDHTLGGWDV